MKSNTLLLLFTSLFLLGCEEDDPEPEIQTIVVEKDLSSVINFEPASAFWYASQAPDSVEIEIKDGIPPYIITNAVVSSAQIRGNKLVFYPDSRTSNTEQKSFINIQDNAGNIAAFNYTVGTLFNSYTRINTASISIKAQNTQATQIFFENDLNNRSAYWDERDDEVFVRLTKGDVDFRFNIKGVTSSGTYPFSGFTLDNVLYPFGGGGVIDYILYGFGNVITITELTKTTFKATINVEIIDRNNRWGPVDDLEVTLDLKK